MQKTSLGFHSKVVKKFFFNSFNFVLAKYILKFMFSEKAKKCGDIFQLVLTLLSNFKSQSKITPNFWGLFGKHFATLSWKLLCKFNLVYTYSLTLALKGTTLQNYQVSVYFVNEIKSFQTCFSWKRRQRKLWKWNNFKCMSGFLALCNGAENNMMFHLNFSQDIF